MSKTNKPVAEASTAKGIKARVLVDGIFGKPNDVAIVTDVQLENGKKSGELDDNAEAVAYAESEGAKAVDKTTAGEPALEE